MQVQLKQSEIESAITLYLSAKGINMVSKQVNMAFTAGRRGTGLTVEVTIDDPKVPDFFEEAPNSLTLVKNEVSEEPSLDQEEPPINVASEGGSTATKPAPVTSLFS